jgi:hypothetical protein
VATHSLPVLEARRGDVGIKKVEFLGDVCVKVSHDYSRVGVGCGQLRESGFPWSTDHQNFVVLPTGNTPILLTAAPILNMI